MGYPLAYVDWIRRFILFHGKRHPADMGAAEVEAFLTHLAVQDKLAEPTQNQALNAIVFLYRHVVKQELGWLEGKRPKKPARLPVVFTREEDGAGSDLRCRLPHRALHHVPLLQSRASRSVKRPSTALKRARDVLKHGPGLPHPAVEVLKGASTAWKAA